MKSCNRSNCSQVNPQPLISFTKNKNTKDGFAPSCKTCAKISAFLYRQTDRGKSVLKKINERYNKTPKGKAKKEKSERKYRKSEKGKIVDSLNNKKYRRTVRGKAVEAAKSAKRRAIKLQATPPWLTKGQEEEMKEIYEMAQELQWLSEKKLHVDHIVPLQGENVSGLHVPWNLQILPQPLNCKKSNKF